jgi:DDE superfamily endonuclease
MDATTRQVRGEWHPTWNQRHTWQHLKGVIRRYAGQGVRALVILWDNAPWHVAAWVHRLVARYNRWAKRHGRLRVLLFALPRRAPWLMPLEAVCRQTKRAVGPCTHRTLAALQRAVDRRLERRNTGAEQQRTTHRSNSLLSA